ncbi:MAG TPA: sodium:proton antiporter [Vicinamibacteria bacterium]|nr:sodium:proton antiporter [Vicinamibacteria bacterium]
MSETEVVLEDLLLILSLASLVAILVKRIHVPYTTALVLAGIGVSFLPITMGIHLSKELVLLIVLPPLLFQGALHMELDDLRKDVLPIAVLALPGLVLATLLVGGMLHVTLEMPWLKGLLFGAMVAATDPISVLAIFREVGAPKRLKTLMEGESLFNDGTSVVLFGALFAVLYEGAEPSALEIGLSFAKVCAGGAGIGFIFGYACYRLMKGLDDHLLEVTLTVVLVFGSFVVAEVLHLSGVIAVVVAGLIIGNYGKLFSMSPRTVETIDNFWEVVDFLINAFLFLLIGLEMKAYVADLERYLVPGGIAVAIVLLARALTVYPVYALFRKTNSSFSLGWAHIMVWGGLKGSIPIALVLGLPRDVAFRAEFLVLTAILVFFSLVVQTLTMKPLVKAVR